MALSEREQQVLRDLEDQLHVEDPSLAHTMDHAETSSGRFSPRHVGAGLALVIGGVAVRHSVASILLGVAGFGLAVRGVTLMLTRVEAPGRRDSSRGDPSGGRSARVSFMDRQSERWERRRDSED